MTCKILCILSILASGSAHAQCSALLGGCFFQGEIMTVWICIGILIAAALVFAMSYACLSAENAVMANLGELRCKCRCRGCE